MNADRKLLSLDKKKVLRHYFCHFIISLFFILGILSPRENKLVKRLSPRKKKLLKRLGHAKCSLKTIANTSINVDKLESQVLKNIILNAVKNYNKKPHGKRWDMENKISALAIYKRSPRTYRHLN